MSKYFDEVTQVGCIVCNRLGYPDSPAELHHIKSPCLGGVGKKARDAFVIPLCPQHHRTGGKGVAFHAGKQEWEMLYGDQFSLFNEVNQIIWRRI